MADARVVKMPGRTGQYMLLGVGPLVGIAKAGHLWVVYDSTGRDLATAGSKQEAIRKAKFIARLLEASPGSSGDRSAENPARMRTYYRLESSTGGYLGEANTLQKARKWARIWSNNYGYGVNIFKAKRDYLKETEGDLVEVVAPPKTVEPDRNPAGRPQAYSRIPPRWTPARVWRGEKGQIHALIGGRQ